MTTDEAWQGILGEGGTKAREGTRGRRQGVCVNSSGTDHPFSFLVGSLTGLVLIKKSRVTSHCAQRSTCVSFPSLGLGYNKVPGSFFKTRVLRCMLRSSCLQDKHFINSASPQTQNQRDHSLRITNPALWELRSSLPVPDLTPFRAGS